MKTFSLFVLCLALSIVGVCAQTGNNNPPPPTTPQVVQVGANFNLWQWETYDPMPNGQFFTHLHQYSELASGLNYPSPSTGQWIPSQELIVPYAQGAIAQQGQHQVIFANNLNTSGAIDEQTPDGKRLSSDIAGLMYYDPTTSQSAQIAQIQDSEGQIIANNQVLYTNAFDGVNADVLYTYKLGGMEQDVILRAQLPTPESFGLNSGSAELVAVTEFLNPPEATVWDIGTDPTGLEPDEAVSWGATGLGRGRAFSLGGEDTPAIVIKQYVNVDGRYFLYEKVRFQDIQQALSALPENASNARGLPGMALKHPQLPKVPTAKATAHPIRLTVDPLVKKGYVLDYVSLNTAYTNFTFQGDTTYYVSGTLTLSGTNTFEGGTVLKYATNASVNVGQVNWLAAPYRPVVFTSKDDNSVGDAISGSTGTPTNYFANPALSLTASGQTLSTFRVACAQQAIVTAANSTTIYNGQFVNCQNGLTASGGTDLLRNVLFANVSTNFNSISSVTVDVQNGTFANSALLASVNSGVTIAITNSVLANVTTLYSGSPALNGGFNGVYNCPPFGNNPKTNTVYPFQMVGAGNYYLSNGCSFFDQGTTNIDATLLADLKNKTTYPPVAYTNITVTNGTWFQTVQRDTNAPDLGFHYDPIDYAVGAVTVFGTLTLTNGVDVAMFYATGAYYGTVEGFLMVGGGDQLITTGTAQSHNQICTFQAVQEQTFWGTIPPNINPLVRIYGTNFGGGPTEWLTARFTDFDGYSGIQFNYGNANTVYGDMMGLDMQDCQIGPGYMYCSTFDGYGSLTNQCINNLFDRASIDFDDYDGSSPVAFYNNTVYNSVATFDHYTSSIWTVRDNLFDTVTVYGTPSALISDHNGYVNTSVLSGSGGNDVVLTNFGYAIGPLGNFYQASTNLVNQGSVTADQRGLYDYTVQTNLADGLEIEETNSVVDIGYHYVATGANGNPLDTLVAGTPDYLADANGNGLPDWWEGAYYGNYSHLGSDLDADGTHTLLYDYDNGLDPREITNGIVGWWKLNETSGIIAHDSFAGNNGVQAGGYSTLWQNPGLLFRAASADFVSFTNTSGAIPASLQVQTFTFTAWVISTNNGAYQGLMGGGGFVNGMPELRIDSANKLELLKQGVIGMGTSTGTVPPNTLCFVACTYNSGSGVIEFYVNGANIGTATSSQTFAYPALGLGYGYGGEAFNGVMADARLYGTVLSSGQIAALYSNQPAMLPYNPLFTTNLVPALSAGWGDVSNAVSQAVVRNYAGVQIPAGVTNWASSLQVTNDISIIGAGTNQTIITNNVGSMMISWQSMSNGFCRLSGIGFEGGTAGGGAFGESILIGGTCHAFRLDSCRFDGWQNQYAIQFNNWVYGVVDHCDFYSSGNPFIELKMDAYGGWQYGDGSWADADNFGTTNALYIENCNFSAPDGVYPPPGMTDGNDGMRTVIRYCNSTNCPVGSHGTENGGRDRGYRLYEIYENNFQYPNTANDGVWGQAFLLRGGTALIWSNTINGGYQFGIGPANYRFIPVSWPTWSNVNGTISWDSNNPALIATGIVQNAAATPNSVNDSTKNWTTNQFVNAVAQYVAYDTTLGYAAPIIGNTATNLTFNGIYNNFQTQYPSSNPSGSAMVASNGDAYQIWQVYAAFDQTGFGQGDLITNSTPTNSVTGTPSWPHEQSSPIYCWSNSFTFLITGFGASAFYPGSDTRDVQISVSKPGYTPLTYPHPLVK